MNDADIDLIISLIAGDLPPEEATAARARIEASSELSAAYDEQLAVASTLRTVPAAAMTTGERDALHAGLRRELHLDEELMPAAAPARRWWIALSGLATTAAIVFAFAVVPNLLDNDGADVVSAPAAEPTTVAELDTMSDGEASVAPTTTAAADAGADTTQAPDATLQLTTTAATEETAPTETTVAEPTEPVYFLSPVAPRSTTFDLPVLDEAVVATSGLEAAIAAATEVASLPFATIAACFTGESETGDLAVTPAGIDADGSAVYAVATHVDSGDEQTVTIDLDTCSVTGAG